MSRFLLALRCFFAVLLRFRLPDDAAKLLPPELKRLPDVKPEPAEAKPVEAKPVEAKPVVICLLYTSDAADE